MVDKDAICPINGMSQYKSDNYIIEQRMPIPEDKQGVLLASASFTVLAKVTPKSNYSVLVLANLFLGLLFLYAANLMLP